MVKGTDKGGREYAEFEMFGEWVRATYLPDPEWAGEPTIRINMVDHKGRVLPGPEFPTRQVIDLLRALFAVVPSGV